MPADAKFPTLREVRYAGVEAGGTSWVVAIAVGDPSNIVERAEFATATPDVVLPRVVAWLRDRPFDALGVASFGPIDLHRATSPKWGYITTTPKPGWRDTDVLGPLRRGLGLADGFPIAFDTDVNAPAASELAAAQRCVLELAIFSLFLFFACTQGKSSGLQGNTKARSATVH